MSRIPETPRLVLTLTVAGLFSGLAIVSAYRLTQPMIRANQAEALREAVFQVVPGSERMQRLVWRDGSFVPAEADTPEEGQARSVYAGYDESGAFRGYAVPGSGAGFQDTIRLIFGYDPEAREILGMQVLESRETPGLGDRIYKDPEFVDEFHGLTVEPEPKLVKGEGEAPNEVDAITGATISSQAVVDIINAASDRWLERLPPSSEVPPLLATEEEAVAPPDAERGGPIPGGRSGD